jgi:RNA polymerase sigma-70 factor (ECF subfamily)
MLNLSEQYIIELIRKGDRKSFEFLFKSYYSSLCKYARGIVHNETTSEDLVMDIFVKIWESQTKLLITSSLSGYLYQSVHNNCLNYLTRRQKRFSELNTETIERLDALMAPDSSVDPLGGINIAELSDRIEQSIEHLPEKCRKIFILSRTDELSHAEIAQQLKISENTVKVQIYRALIKLRILLKDYLPGSLLS